MRTARFGIQFAAKHAVATFKAQAIESDEQKIRHPDDQMSAFLLESHNQMKRLWRGLFMEKSYTSPPAAAGAPVRSLTMRRPTGPGKIKDNRNLPPAQRQGVTGLLYNFDIDDAS